MTYFTPDHEWLTLDGDIATVGITRHAAEALGDLIFVEAKPVGTRVAAKEPAAVVESVKAASDIYAPASGEVVEINTRLAADPGLVNNDPEAEGWLFKLKLSDKSELEALLDRAAYGQLVGQ